MPSACEARVMSGVSATAARSAASDRRRELGPSEGLPVISPASHGCRSRVARSACATAAKPARQSGADSGSGFSPCTASTIRSTSSSRLVM